MTGWLSKLKIVDNSNNGALLSSAYSLKVEYDLLGSTNSITVAENELFSEFFMFDISKATSKQLFYQMTDVSIGATAFGGVTDTSGLVYQYRVTITKPVYDNTKKVYAAPYMTITP
jgi:hypothetical protein